MRSLFLISLAVVVISGYSIPKKDGAEIQIEPKTHTYRKIMRHEFPSSHSLRIQKLSKKVNNEVEAKQGLKEEIQSLTNQELEVNRVKDSHDSNLINSVAKMEAEGRDLAGRHLQEELDNIEGLVGTDRFILEQFSVLKKATVDIQRASPADSQNDGTEEENASATNVESAGDERSVTDEDAKEEKSTEESDEDEDEDNDGSDDDESEHEEESDDDDDDDDDEDDSERDNHE